MLITYHGPLKQFFKDFPVEKRKFNVVYKIINNSGVKYYTFRGTLGEKHLRYFYPEELFDLNNISDLSDKVRKSLSNKYNTVMKNIQELFFKTDRFLTVNELLVGYWRCYKKEIKRDRLVTYLSRLYKNGFLEKNNHQFRRAA